MGPAVQITKPTVARTRAEEVVRIRSDIFWSSMARCSVTQMSRDAWAPQETCDPPMRRKSVPILSRSSGVGSGTWWDICFRMLKGIAFSRRANQSVTGMGASKTTDFRGCTRQASGAEWDRQRLRKVAKVWVAQWCHCDADQQDRGEPKHPAAVEPRPRCRSDPLESEDRQDNELSEGENHFKLSPS